MPRRYVVYGDGSLLVMADGDDQYRRYAENFAEELLRKHDQVIQGIEKDLLNYLGGRFAEEVTRRAGGEGGIIAHLGKRSARCVSHLLGMMPQGCAKPSGPGVMIHCQRSIVSADQPLSVPVRWRVSFIALGSVGLTHV